MPSKCRSCGAAISWAKTSSGKRIPIDPEPSPKGNLVLRGDAEKLAIFATAVNADARELRYTSHFANCPNAASHRRSKT